MWTRNSNCKLWCFYLQLSESNQSTKMKSDLNNNSRHKKNCLTTKSLTDKRLLNKLGLINIMFIWSLIIGVLLCPTVLCQEEDGGEATSPPDTAELVLEEGNPCKANPCGNGVCLQDKEK